MAIAAFLYEDVCYTFSQKFKALRKEMRDPDVDFPPCYSTFWTLEDLAKSIDPQILQHPLVERPYQDCSERLNFLIAKECGDIKLSKEVERAMEGEKC